MKIAVLLFFVVAFCSCGHADSYGSHACNSSSLGGGITCQNYFYYDTATNACQASVSVNYTPASTTHDVIVIAYDYGMAVKCPNASSAVMSITDNKGDVFSASANTPFVHTGYDKYYVWHIRGTSSGTTSFTMTCSIAGACAYMSFWAFESTTGCTIEPCIVGDKYAYTTTSSSSGNITSGSVPYTNTLSVAFFTTSNDENPSPVSPYLSILDPRSCPLACPGNAIQGIFISSAGTQTAQATWSPADSYDTVIFAVKTSSSVGGPAPPTNLQAFPR